jgi:hypothetical protein
LPDLTKVVDAAQLHPVALFVPQRAIAREELEHRKRGGSLGNRVSIRDGCAPARVVERATPPESRRVDHEKEEGEEIFKHG